MATRPEVQADELARMNMMHASENAPKRLHLSSSPPAETHEWPEGAKELADPVERRRQQNRLNQRAYRLRKRAQQRHPDAQPSTQPKESSSTSPSDAAKLALAPPSEKNITKHKEKDSPSPQYSSCVSQVSSDRLRQFTETAYRSYILGHPTADHLLTLSKVNVFRAFGVIMDLLGMSPSLDWMHDDALSPFTTQGPGVAGDGRDGSLPPSLRPTTLQKTHTHHPWLDFFPIPKIRDNLLRAGESFDDEALCVDIMGFWDSSPTSSNCTLLVWGEPTDPGSWEVTEDFLRRWPWAIRGCPELLQSTNYWRRQRGEMMLFRYV